MKTPELLLDTCVILFALEGKELRTEATALLEKAGESGTVYVSPASAWEIGKLVATRKLSLPIEPLDYFNTFASAPGISVCNLSPEVLVRSSFLPHFTHKDPWDCIFIATARINNYTLVTSDSTILAYGAAGHVKTLAC